MTMRKWIKPLALLLCGILAAGLLAGCGKSGNDSPSGAAPSTSFNEPMPFRVTSPAIVDGVLSGEYGRRADEQAEMELPPVVSFPLRFENAPEGTACYALIMEDPDSAPVVGYVCDHWLAANIPTSLEKDASQSPPEGMVQGLNYQNTGGYIGPTPPQGTHTYILTVYALAAPLPLANGFSRGQLESAISDAYDNGTLLAQTEAIAQYGSKAPTA